MTTYSELKNKKGSDPTQRVHITSPQDNTKGSSANPSSGKWPKGGKTIGRKAKKAGVAGWQRAGNKGDCTKGKTMEEETEEAKEKDN
ncbi:MAG: hypothetical protein PUC66_05240 [Erysipelotrichaceae bacterium]|nr:hypothetical protein [Erysipelotrichaceae bacterium]